MERYHNLSPDSQGKIFTDLFTKCSDDYIVSIWSKFIHFAPTLKPAIHRIGN